MREPRQKRLFVRSQREYYTIDMADEQGDSIESRIVSSATRTLAVVRQKIEQGFFISEDSLSKLTTEASRF